MKSAWPQIGRVPRSGADESAADRSLRRVLTPDPASLRACRVALPSVSRTFALTIRALPGALRDAVTVSYLLCRLADLLEDATGGEPALRIDGLKALARGLTAVPFPVVDLAAALSPAEALLPLDDAGARLLRARDVVFRAFASLPGETQELISLRVQTMAMGMASFVERERSRDCGLGPALVVLGTAEEMRLYAYYVAGTVGQLLTDLFSRYLNLGAKDSERLRALAVPFGLGLQYTNILQDLAEDRRRGWSYLPEELARTHGTSVQAFDDPAERSRVLRIVGDIVREAAACLDRAMEYTLLLPRRAPRLRLFCAWPVFFAVRTLVRIWGEEEVLVGSERVRISRAEVRRIVRTTLIACFSNRELERLYDREKARLERRIRLSPL